MKQRPPQWAYGLLYCLVSFALHIWHPFTRIRGRENIPDGCCIIAANHSAMSDPVWLLLALGIRGHAAIMAKQELMEKPLLGRFLLWIGAFGIDRGGADIGAIKTALGILKDGGKLVIFPEGTRVKPGNQVEAKTGVAMIANRAAVPILPVYISTRKYPFCPIRVEIGKTFPVVSAGRRITSAELDSATTGMMRNIYALGDQT